ncbi:MAG: phage holin family protein [Lysobacter sp.]
MGIPGEDRLREDDPPIAPDITETLRQIGLTGRASLSAFGDTAKSLRALLAADVSLARSALGRTLAMGGVAIVCGASFWLFLMSALVVFLHGAGRMSWPMALMIPATISLVVTCVAFWRAVAYFEHTRMGATRRQLARMGIGELADFMPPPHSAHSARDAEEGKPPREASAAPAPKSNPPESVS